MSEEYDRLWLVELVAPGSGGEETKDLGLPFGTVGPGDAEPVREKGLPRFCGDGDAMGGYSQGAKLYMNRDGIKKTRSRPGAIRMLEGKEKEAEVRKTSPGFAGT